MSILVTLCWITAAVAFAMGAGWLFEVWQLP